MSHDIELHIDHEPVWPNLCVRCLTTDPGSEFRIRAGRIGWDQLLTLGWAAGSRPRLNVPACSPCAKKLRRARIVRGVLSVLSLLLVVAVVIVVLKWSGLMPTGPYRRWFQVGTALAVWLPFLFVFMFNPPSVDATAKGKKIDYEFKEELFADYFHSLNTHAFHDLAALGKDT